MVIHIMTDNIFSKEFIKYINQYYDYNNHLFIIYNEDPKKLRFTYDESYHNVLFYGMTIDLQKLKKYMDNAERIILHSLFIKFEFFKLFFLQKNICKKSIPVFWGGDLYKKKNEDIKTILKSSIREFMTKYLLKNAKGIGYLTQQDFIYFQDRYHYIKPSYPLIYSMQYLDDDYLTYLETLRNRKQPKEKINIQIGHSCDLSLNHITVLEDLSKYKNENIEILIPLSYGDKLYRDKVVEIGKNLYKDKFNPLTDFMEFKEYTQLLGSIDLLIMNTDRQIGLGNIYTSILLNTAICVKKDSPLGRFLNTEIGIEFIDYEDLIHTNILNPFEINKIKNRIKIEEYLSRENFDKKWKPLLECEAIYE